MNLTTFLAKLDVDQQAQFCDLTGTTHNYMLLQLLGGHRAPSLRLLASMQAASRTMFPKEQKLWLSLDDMHEEFERIQKRRAELSKRSPRGGKR